MAKTQHEGNEPTIRIASDETESGYIIIYEDQFDPAKHKLYQEPAPKSESKTKSKE